MKKILVYLFLGGVVFTSCSKDDKITPEIDFNQALELPENTAWQKRVKVFYDDFNTYVRMDYTVKDVKWNWDSRRNYEHTLPKSEEDAEKLFNFMDETLFQVYPDELLRKMLPYQILLADTLNATKNTKVQSYALSGMNHIIFGGAGPKTFPQTAATKLAAAKEIHECFALSLIAKVEEQPEAFWAVSTYERMGLTSDAMMYQQGYVYRNKVLPPDKDKDYSTYVAWVASNTKAQIEAVTDVYPLVKKKVELLRQYYAAQLDTNLDDLMRK
ncbi:hypothetical protein [Sphingobacterium paucimobilis]|uniref:Lipoprotein n=1 Tax=Sphingobacterium paucimobilis HER1398 TaxID=1346330 RepID=U2HTJ7_9SPHI|nr:hypothetical protein [Sphingobacterium paucimobilis]ERJ58837.1 hypothetical protein M472_08650 [Sphingobacterium paucimobilis HER1398]